MEQKQLRVHETTKCRYRDYKCCHCSCRGTYNNVTTNHLTVYESFRLPCVAGCKWNLTRRGMTDHLVDTCSEELAACPHERAICASVVKRKNLEEHASDKDLHLQVLMESYASSMETLYDAIQCGLRPDVFSVPLAFRPWLLNTPTVGHQDGGISGEGVSSAVAQ